VALLGACVPFGNLAVSVEILDIIPEFRHGIKMKKYVISSATHDITDINPYKGLPRNKIPN